MYPEAANQTIYTRQARQQDAGIYKCVLRNETHKTEHSIELNIQGKQYWIIFSFTNTCFERCKYEESIDEVNMKKKKKNILKHNFLVQ